MGIKKTQTARDRRAIVNNKLSLKHTKQPIMEHAYELRRRIYYIVMSVAISGTAVYLVQQHVVNFLLKPSHGEHFIYTTPGGGVDFLFKVCIYSGLIISTPVIVYNVLEFISPIITRSSKHFATRMCIISTLLAFAGVMFGYFIGLPAALHFLLHQFTTVQIKPLVTIQSYLNFVIAYILGSALLFQLPIILICINRVKPLKPSRLFHYERWVILAAFVLSGLMNPTPNILSQLIVAGPFILMYQVGIGIIAIMNRSKYPTSVIAMIEQDNINQANRFNTALSAIPLELKQPEVPTIPVLEKQVSEPKPEKATPAMQSMSIPIIQKEESAPRVKVIPIIQT